MGKLFKYLGEIGMKAGGNCHLIDINVLAKECYELDLSKGFSFDNFGERIARIHEEVSEAWRDYREGIDTGLGEELADVLLTVLGLAFSRGINIYKEVLDKHEINKKRSYKHGGKRC